MLFFYLFLSQKNFFNFSTKKKKAEYTRVKATRRFKKRDFFFFFWKEKRKNLRILNEKKIKGERDRERERVRRRRERERKNAKAGDKAVQAMSKGWAIGKGGEEF